jgi:hypothetical protein
LRAETGLLQSKPSLESGSEGRESAHHSASILRTYERHPSESWDPVTFVERLKALDTSFRWYDERRPSAPVFASTTGYHAQSPS